MSERLRLTPVEGTLAVCRLAPDAVIPSWVHGHFTSVTRTADELSIVCDQSSVPADVRCERGWRALRVAGSLSFEMTGVASGISSPLAAAGISLLLIGTFDTDYLLVKEEHFDRAEAALRSAGFDVAGNQVS